MDADIIQIDPNVPPASLKGLRACLVCSLIKTGGQFKEVGCENCPVLKMEGDSGMVNICTSPNFTGMIALMENDPEQSWVCKWQRFGNRIPGCYAIKVVGELPEHIIEELAENGVTYVPPSAD